jgi:hypothetical protein
MTVTLKQCQVTLTVCETIKSFTYKHTGLAGMRTEHFKYQTGAVSSETLRF